MGYFMPELIIIDISLMLSDLVLPGYARLSQCLHMIQLGQWGHFSCLRACLSYRIYFPTVPASVVQTAFAHLLKLEFQNLLLISLKTHPPAETNILRSI